MPLLIHLSDLHLDVDSRTATDVSAALVAALEHDARVGDPKYKGDRLLLFTGDVFDSGSMSPRTAIPHFLALHEAILSVLGQRVPTILVPGNHDRRRWRLLGPQRNELFNSLRRAVDPSNMFAASCATPLL